MLRGAAGVLSSYGDVLRRIELESLETVVQGAIPMCSMQGNDKGCLDSRLGTP
jgi:hypothetical protein